MGPLSTALARGAVAGLAGTVAMTMAQQLEMAATGRAPSSVPGQVAARLLGRREELDAARLSTPAHWGFGVATGALRGALAEAGLRGMAGHAAFLALMWAGDAVLYKSVGVADWPWRWTGPDLARDLGFDAVYAAVTGLAYDALERTGT